VRCTINYTDDKMRQKPQACPVRDDCCTRRRMRPLVADHDRAAIIQPGRVDVGPQVLALEELEDLLHERTGAWPRAHTGSAAGWQGKVLPGMLIARRPGPASVCRRSAELYRTTDTGALGRSRVTTLTGNNAQCTDEPALQDGVPAVMTAIRWTRIRREQTGRTGRSSTEPLTSCYRLTAIICAMRPL